MFHQYLLMTRLWILNRFSAFWGILWNSSSTWSPTLDARSMSPVAPIASSKMFLLCFHFHLISTHDWTHDSFYSTSYSPFRSSLHICSLWYFDVDIPLPLHPGLFFQSLLPPINFGGSKEWFTLPFHLCRMLADSALLRPTAPKIKKGGSDIP